MGILDEAIREHLELKRQHGADDTVLKKLEDDAFGPPERPGANSPDPVAEAATEFMAQPDLGDDGADSGAVAESEPPVRREPQGGLVDLQEAPEAPSKDEEAEEDEEPREAEEEEASEVAEEDHPATEHEALPDPVSSGPNTEERNVIADQPTQMYDVEEALAAEQPPSEEPAPPDEDLVAEEIAEPRLAPAEPIHDLEPAVEDEPEAEEDEEDDFFSEQRLSDELDQALEAPAVEDEPESAEHEVEHTDEHEAVAESSPEEKDHDALEDTPDFLEEAPEDDKLWFEQKPPKDFDFDD